MKSVYEKPEIEKIEFSVQEKLATNPDTGSGVGSSLPDDIV